MEWSHGFGPLIRQHIIVEAYFRANSPHKPSKAKKQEEKETGALKSSLRGIPPTAQRPFI
jgi:hypothetical protein